MEAPEVNEKAWIKIGPNAIDGYVFSKISPTKLSVGYYQNGVKAIKEDVIWNGSSWIFEFAGPCGSYLKGHEEAIVKRGPRA